MIRSGTGVRAAAAGRVADGDDDEAGAGAAADTEAATRMTVRDTWAFRSRAAIMGSPPWRIISRNRHESPAPPRESSPRRPGRPLPARRAPASGRVHLPAGRRPPRRFSRAPPPGPDG